jgi:dihydropteroate synthase
VECRVRHLKTKIMGIINATPDSFYPASQAGGKEAVSLALHMEECGADIIDIGGESTRPGSDPVSADEELRRIIPIIEGLDGISAKISVDTYRPEVAIKAIKAGASVINDIGGMGGTAMRRLAAENGVEVVIMHMKGAPKTMQESPAYSSVVSEIYSFFEDRISLCEADGIEPGKIIIDPGLGFGKTTQHNLEILRGIKEFRGLGKRILVGASRKSFIGKIIGSEAEPASPEDRLGGSLAVAVYCALQGVDIVRVHDVEETARAIKVAELLF